MCCDDPWNPPIAAVAWIGHGEIGEYVPYGLFESVQKYLDGALPR